MPLPLLPFTTDEITGCSIEVPTIANKAPRIPPSFVFLIYVLLF